ncbi:MAG: glycoside hydrolase, partial [Chloroflexi bacterium]|nr:glycoside hydrolase [Chloroflexota bacterium]
MATFAHLVFSQGALSASYQVNWYAVAPRFARGLRRYHPIGPAIRLETLGSDGKAAPISLKASAILTFQMDKFPAPIPGKLGILRATSNGWEQVASSFDSTAKTLSVKVDGLPVTFAVVDSSKSVSPATPDPSDPAAVQFPDGYWGLAAVDDSGNLIFQKTTNSDNSASWTVPTVVDTASSSPAVTRLGSTLAIFFTKSDGTYQQVFVRTSTNEGATWSAATQLSSETASVYQVQASNVADTVYVFWSLALSMSNNYTSSPLNYRTSTDLSTWTTEATVGQQVGPLGDFIAPGFDLEPLTSGTWMLSWIAPSASDPTDYSYPVLWAATTTDLGSASWSNAQELCVNLGSIYGPRWPAHPSIAQDSTGTVWLAYGEYGWPSTSYDLYYKTSADGGATWNPSGNNNGNLYQPGSADNTYLVVTSGGTPRSFFNENGSLWYKDMPSGATTQVVGGPIPEPAPTDVQFSSEPNLRGFS